MKYLRLVFLLSFIFIMSCDDDERIITLEGKINDPNLNILLENVEVKLYTKSTDGGTVSYVFEYYSTTLTNENGEFKFDLPFNYTLAYRLDFFIDNYFSYSVEIQSEELESDHYFSDYELFPEAYLNIHLDNSFPFDVDDKIMYRIIGWESSCDGCCPPGFHEYIGDDIDETIVCKIIGELEYTVEYIVFKNGNSNVSHHIVFCPAFEETYVDISY